MATYYGSYVSSAFRSRADVTTSTSNTQVTISATGYCQMADYYHDSGENFFRKIVIGSDTPNTYVTASTAYFSGGGTYGVGSSSRTYNRTHAAQSIEVGVAIHNNGVYTGWSTADSYARTTITVPAKPSYAVSFNANGGSGAPSAQTKWYGEALTLSSTKPTCTGYTFKGWNTKSDGTGTSYSAGGTVAAATNQALTLYAQWTAITYTVAYAANGGSSTPSSQTKTYGVALTLRAAISHANATATYTVSYSANYSGGTNPSSATATKTTKYAFSGWKATNGTVYAASGSYTANAATTMTAQWTSSASTTSVTLPTPTRTGHTFGGWYKEAACTNKVGNGGATYTPTATVTLYAKWTINTWTVAFNANGGSGAPSSQTKTYGVDLTLSSTKPTRTNYTFKSWNTKSDGTGTTYAAGAKYTANAAATLYAQWTQNTWTVAYAANGGSSTPSSQTKVAGTALTLRAAITRASVSSAITTTLNANGGTVSSSSLSSTKTTAYAFSKWKATDGTLYAASGSYTKDAATTMTAQWTSSTSYTSVTLPTPTRTGYTFSGWYTAATGGTKVGDAGASHKPTADATLYAQWAVITYTVTFNANGGSGAPSTQTKTYGVELTLSSTKPARSGYTFLGWATKSDGTGTAYSPGGKVAKDANSDLTLYAVWVAVQVTSLSAYRSDSAGTRSYGGTYGHLSAGWKAMGTIAGTVAVTATANDASVTSSLSNRSGSKTATADLSNTSVGTFGGSYAQDAAVNVLVTATLTVSYGGASRSVSATRVATIPKVFRLLDALHGGTGLAIGAVATLANTFEVALQTVFQNVVEVVQSNITHDGTYTEPTNGDHPFRFVDGARNVLSYIAAHKTSNSQNNYLRLTAIGPSGSKTANLYLSASDTEGHISTDADVTTLRSLNATVDVTTPEATINKVKSTPRSVSYIAGANGDAALYAPKSGTSQWYPAVCLDTNEGGSWQIGNYNDEALEFIYATKANRDSNTNTVSKMKLLSGNGTIYTTTNKPSASDVGALPIGGGTLTGNVSQSATSRGYFLKDSAGHSYPGVHDNGANLWIGSTQAASTHHTGGTYISSGYNATDGKGNATINVCVPNAANNGGTSYGVYHTGNKPSASDVGALPIGGGTLTGGLMLSSGGVTTTTAAHIIKDTRFDRDGANPSSDVWSAIFGFRDKDGENLGYLQVYQTTSGATWLNLHAVAEDSSGGTYSNYIRLAVDKSGNKAYLVGDAAAFRSAIGAQASGDYAYSSTSQHPCFWNAGGSDQLWGLSATCQRSTNTSYYGKQVGLLMTNTTCGCYNNTDSASLWTAYTTANKPSAADIGAIDDVTTSSKTVSLPANSSSVSVAAPSVSGYTFVCWLQVAGSGHTNPGYMQDPKASTTNLWSAVGSTTGARNWLVTALYKK